jgi:hypothetical protein
MKDLDPGGAEANVLRKMATGKELAGKDFPGMPDWDWATRAQKEGHLKGVLMRLKAGGYIGSREVGPCQNYRGHHVEWFITTKGMEMATVLEVMET